MFRLFGWFFAFHRVGEKEAQMLERYTLPAMRELWSDKEKFERWLRVEVAALRARAELGDIGDDVHDVISVHARVIPERVAALDAEFEHDMIAFVKAVQESLEQAGVGTHGKEFHKGLTSYDVEDPALLLALREAIQLILGELETLAEVLRRKAREHQWTMMIARTHGQYAEPTTFGQILLVYAYAVRRSVLRLRYLLAEELMTGKMSGAVGTYGGLNPQLETRALDALGFLPAEAETQILQRDRHAMVVAALAVAAGTIEQMCRTFWEMMRSDVRELEEPRKPRQRGSSAMPHKKNPILTERLMGLARMVRACAGAAFENIATPEWRDISQSSVERHIFPIATGLVHYMAVKAAFLVDHLRVFPERMLRHLTVTSCGVWAGQPVRLALMEAGVASDFAYEYIQQAAFEAMEREVHLRDLLGKRPFAPNDPRTAADVVGRERLAECFNPRAWIERGIQHLFREEGEARDRA